MKPYRILLPIALLPILQASIHVAFADGPKVIEAKDPAQTIEFKSEPVVTQEDTNAKIRLERTGNASFDGAYTINAGAASGQGDKLIITEEVNAANRVIVAPSGTELSVREDGDCGIGNVCSGETSGLTGTPGSGMTACSIRDDSSYDIYMYRVGNEVTLRFTILVDPSADDARCVLDNFPLRVGNWTRVNELVVHCIADGIDVVDGIGRSSTGTTESSVRWDESGFGAYGNTNAHCIATYRI